MRISVVIPVLNEQAVVAAAVQRAWAAGVHEVILSDGGSSDGTVESAKAANCHVISTERGRASQMNAGAAIATGDVLLFMHADNWLAEGGCAQIRETMGDLDVSWGGFRQRIEDSNVLFRLIERGNSMRCQYQRLVYGDQGLFVRRSLFESLGGFPSLPLMEDFELSRRLAEHGHPALLSGPIHVSARRWNAKGLARQTLRNWVITGAYRLGVSPSRLATWYNA